MKIYKRVDYCLGFRLPSKNKLPARFGNIFVTKLDEDNLLFTNTNLKLLIEYLNKSAPKFDNKAQLKEEATTNGNLNFLFIFIHQFAYCIVMLHISTIDNH